MAKCAKGTKGAITVNGKDHFPAWDYSMETPRIDDPQFIVSMLESIRNTMLEVLKQLEKLNKDKTRSRI